MYIRWAITTINFYIMLMVVIEITTISWVNRIEILYSLFSLIISQLNLERNLFPLVALV